MHVALSHTHTHTHWKNLRGGLTKMPQVKWIKSNEMYWEDRYVKGCCWQLLLLPRWLVPNDRPTEKGASDNTSTTIQQILVPFGLFIFLPPPLFYALLSTLTSSQSISGCFTSLHGKCTLFLFVGWELLPLKIAYHQLCNTKVTHRHTHTHIWANTQSHFVSPPASSSYVPQINIQAAVGGGAVQLVGLTCCIGLLEQRGQWLGPQCPY